MRCPIASSNEIVQEIIKNRGMMLAAFGLDDEEAISKIVCYLKGIGGKNTKVISLIGGAASGKSKLARSVASSLKNTEVISTDDFVLGSRDYRRKYIEGKSPLLKYDFDLLREKVNRIKSLRPGESEPMPMYDEQDGTAIKIIDFDPETGQVLSIDKNNYDRKVQRVKYLILEGDFQPLASPDFQIFFHVSDDVRLQNRILRDVKERGARSVEETVNSFELRQRSQHKPYTLSCVSYTDMIILVSTIPTGTGYEYKYSFWVAPSQ